MNENLFQSPFFPLWNTADPRTFGVLKNDRKIMRDKMTRAEALLWAHIKSNKLGVKFRRQHIIENFIPDFVALSAKLIVEVDGEIHRFQKEYDDDRTFILEQKGFRVIRFTNEEVLGNVNHVVAKIKETLNPQTPKRGL